MKRAGLLLHTCSVTNQVQTFIAVLLPEQFSCGTEQSQISRIVKSVICVVATSRNFSRRINFSLLSNFSRFKSFSHLTPKPVNENYGTLYCTPRSILQLTKIRDPTFAFMVLKLFRYETFIWNGRKVRREGLPDEIKSLSNCTQKYADQHLTDRTFLQFSVSFPFQSNSFWRVHINWTETYNGII